MGSLLNCRAMIEVIQFRGACAEATTTASAAFVRAGHLVELVGDDRETTFRSASKPFQLVVSLESLDDPGVDDEDLALGAASHSAEPVHVARVEGLLRRFDLRPEGLRCGAHAPTHVPSAEAVIRAGGRYTALHNNCSGKHAFMLAACAHRGWDPEYLPAEHPLQARNREMLAHWMGYAPSVAVDGCGVPTFCQPLSAVARAWWRLARAMRDLDTAGADDSWTRRLGRVGHAMARHPELTSGTGRLDLEVVRAARETMAVKIGAMGLFCIALPGRDAALAVKVHAGSTEALPALTSWALARWAPEAWCEPEAWEARVVRNVAGRAVGAWAVRAP